MFSLLPLRVLYFPCYVEVSLDSKFERIKKKNPKIFQSILYRMDKWNLFLSTNVLLFDVFNILIHHFMLFFSILCYSSVKKRNFMSKGVLSQTEWFFFWILCRMGIYFKRLIIYQKWCHNENKQHAICYCAI